MTSRDGTRTGMGRLNAVVAIGSNGVGVKEAGGDAIGS